MAGALLPWRCSAGARPRPGGPSRTAALSGPAFQLASPDGGRSQWQFVKVRRDTAGGLVGSYSFESGVGNATAFGNPAFGTTCVCTGQDLKFEGFNDYLRLPNDVANSENITVAAWVKWGGGDAWQRIFDFNNNQDQYFMLTPMFGSGTLQMAITDSGPEGVQHLDCGPLPVDEWVHVAVTLGGNTGVIYVYGRPVTAGRVSLNPADFGPVRNCVGRSAWPDPYFKGEIDEFKVFDFALTAE